MREQKRKRVDPEEAQAVRAGASLYISPETRARLLRPEYISQPEIALKECQNVEWLQAVNSQIPATPIHNRDLRDKIGLVVSVPVMVDGKPDRQPVRFTGTVGHFLCLKMRLDILASSPAVAEASSFSKAN